MEKSMPALDFIELMEPRDFPHQRHLIVPGVDNVQLQWDDDRGVLMGPDASGKHYSMSQEAYSQMGWILGINRPTLRRLPPPETIPLVNQQLTKSSQPYLAYAMRNGQIVHWVRGGNNPATCFSIVRAVARALLADLSNCMIYFSDDTLDSTLFNVADPTRPNIVGGEPVAFGIAVQNSLSWSHALRLSAYTHHLEPDVGAVVGSYFSKFTRRRQLDAQEDWIEKSIGEILSNTTTHIDNMVKLHSFPIGERENLVKLMHSIFEDLRAPLGIRNSLYDLVIAHPVETLYDVYMVIAGMAANMVDYDWLNTQQRYRILELAGDFALHPDRCPCCFRLPL